MYPFFTLRKHQKTLRFSDVLVGVEKRCCGNKWLSSSTKDGYPSSSDVQATFIDLFSNQQILVKCQAL